MSSSDAIAAVIAEVKRQLVTIASGHVGGESSARIEQRLKDAARIVPICGRYLRRRFGLAYRLFVIEQRLDVNADTLARVDYEKWRAKVIAALDGCERAAARLEALTVRAAADNEQPPLQPPLSKAPQIQPTAPNA